MSWGGAASFHASARGRKQIPWHRLYVQFWYNACCPAFISGNQQVTGNSDLAFDYEDELNLLVLATSVDDEVDVDDSGRRSNGLVQLQQAIILDNQNYKVLRSVPLNDVMRYGEGIVDLEVTFDKDLLLFSLKSHAKVTTFIYRLEYAADSIQEQEREM